MKKIISLILLSAILFSCGTKFSLQKRRYNKGFYFASNHQQKSNKLESETPLKAPKQKFSNAEEPVNVIVLKEVAKPVESKVENKLKPVKEKVIAFISSQIALKHNINTLKVFSPNSKLQVGQSISKQKIEKQSILKRVIRKVLRKLAFLLLIVAAVFYLLGFFDSTFIMLAYLCAALAIILLIIAILTRIT